MLIRKGVLKFLINEISEIHYEKGLRECQDNASISYDSTGINCFLILRDNVNLVYSNSLVKLGNKAALKIPGLI